MCEVMLYLITTIMKYCCKVCINVIDFITISRDEEFIDVLDKRVNICRC